MTESLIIPEYDMHVHTVLCGHAHESATVERLSAHASVLHMKLLCFSEHVHDEVTLEQLQTLRHQVDRVRPLCSCRLAMAGEIDVDAMRCDGSLVVTPPPWMEFVIGSIHYIPETDVLPRGGYVDYHLDRDEVLKKWRSTLLGLARNPLVDMIGHPGAMIGILMQGFPDDVLEVFRQAAELSARRGQFWDFNDLSFDKLAGMEEEYCRVLQIAIDCGVTMLYGSDTHNVASLGRVDNVLRAVAGLRGIDAGQLLHLPPVLAQRFNLN